MKATDFIDSLDMKMSFFRDVTMSFAASGPTKYSNTSMCEIGESHLPEMCPE